MQTRTRSYARPLVAAIVISTCFLVALSPRLAAAQVSLPPGFAEFFVADVTDPTAMQFAPDGRLFVCEQAGTLRVIKNGALLPTPFVTLPVNAAGERGLLGVAFDPAFDVNQYVYVYWTATTPTLHNRVSRFTANGDVAIPGSEVVIFDLPTLNTVATNHNGGALNFGADGKLYIAVGENNVPANSQSLTTTLGKMLRINPDGTIPADNPFFGVTTGQNRAIWALGLRNPFTFAFDGAGTRMFINDVGELNWEEINDGIAGANYGWPDSEGNTTDPGITSPTYTYSHPTGCAITGGAFYHAPNTQFPFNYSGVYFFTDICGWWIKMLDPANGNAVTTFASGIIYPVALAVSPSGDLYYLDRNHGGVHRISYVSGSVTADSVTPNSGSGATQTFAMRYSSSSGAGSIATAFALFNGPSGGSCLVHYDPSSNTLGLLNDAGNGYAYGMAGASGSLANSRCAVTLAGASAAFGGNTLTLTLPMTFLSGFAGAKSVYLYAANAAGGNSGWQSRGSWTVPAGGPAVVTADSVTPATGTGLSQAFALQVSDTTGAGNLQTVFAWFTAASASSPANSCLVYFDRPSNVLGLLNDAATQYVTGTAGASGTISNSQCSIALGGATTSVSGNTLTLTLPMTFTSAFAGVKNVHLYAANASGVNSGWPIRGDWTVPAGGPGPGPIPGVTAVSVAPASGSGASQTFAYQFGDTTGAINLSTMYVLFSGSGGGSCLARYDRAAAAVSLLNDAGNAYLSGTAGAAGSLANSRCTITLGLSSASISGNTLTLNLAMSFASAFAGALEQYLYAANTAGLNSGWQNRGTWTVPAGGGPGPAVTADSVLPASGTGASQVFAVQVSDTAGAINLVTAFVLFSGPGASCLVHFDRPSNTVGLLNDAGTQYVTGTAGAAGTLANSRCSIVLGSTTASLNGTAMTLDLSMAFASGFAGAKDVYLYGANSGGLTSGWQARGTWTVP